ncbi:hypothetical protein ACUYOF_10660, partial [Photobacterium ganghwense]|uniref:hypothetical protein n=1 Tax=Photobacterium ganghwense TaxID=320778 RepID=UPI0040574CAA
MPETDATSEPGMVCSFAGAVYDLFWCFKPGYLPDRLLSGFFVCITVTERNPFFFSLFIVFRVLPLDTPAAFLNYL